MNPSALRTLAACAGLFAATFAHAQNPLANILTAGSTDVAAVKQKAEAGDAAAQVTFANILAAHFRQTEALEWFRKAAAQGNTVGEFNVGKMLLCGAHGSPPDLSVQPNPPEGLRWTFMAATNRYAYAYRYMAEANRQGLGTATNMVAAYAWFKLSADASPSPMGGHVEMNEMALNMDTADIQRAVNLAALWKAGHWQAPVIKVTDDSRLNLVGIIFSARNRFAIINGKLQSEGESANVPVKPGFLPIKCLKIQKDSALISVEGENQPQLLLLK